MAAQKKIGIVIAILTLLLNPRGARKSQGEISQLSVVAAVSACLRLYSSQATRLPLQLVYNLHCDRRFDRWMRVVADKLEIFELETVNVFYGGIQFHSWQGSTFP
jgi:hypothetical protein